MKPVATHVQTPVGRLPAPLDPAWPARLAECEDAEDLFGLVLEHGFVNPDALAEVLARGWYSTYLEWIGIIGDLERRNLVLPMQDSSALLERDNSRNDNLHELQIRIQVSQEVVDRLEEQLAQLRRVLGIQGRK